MPSVIHQWLAVWTARRMVRDGFDPLAFDGPGPQGGAWNLLPHCPTLGVSRPDVLGVREPRELAVGEAKTAADLMTRRTLRQLGTFGSLRSRETGAWVPLYVAVPASAASALERTLAALGLHTAAHVVRLLIPDVFLRGTP